MRFFSNAVGVGVSNNCEGLCNIAVLAKRRIADPFHNKILIEGSTPAFVHSEGALIYTDIF